MENITPERPIVCLLLAVSVVILAACSKNEREPLTDAVLTDSEALIISGSKQARVCTGCHGPKGISRIPSNPSLAGRPQEYLAEQLQAFRDGERQNPTMSSMTRHLSDADIAALSHYFASLPGPVEN